MKPLFTSKTSTSTFVAGLLSAASHALLIAVGLYLLNVADQPKPVALPSFPVKIRITQIDAPKAATPTVSTGRPQFKSQEKTPAKAAEQSPGESTIAEVANQRYEDFFPSPSPGKYGSVADTAGRDEISFEVKAKNLGKLEGFAKEFSQYVSIPIVMRRVASSGVATLRFIKKEGIWTATRVRGDPYFRAIVLEAAATLSQRSYALKLLNDTDYTAIWIELSFATVSPLNDTVKPLVTSTEGNKVFLAFTHKMPAGNWNLAMPVDNKEGNDSAAPNLIGIGSAIVDALNDARVEDDLGLKKLRTSPAFSRPFGE